MASGLNGTARVGPWLHSARFDLTFFIGPAIVSLLLVFPALIGWLPRTYAPLWTWLVLVVFVDVAHVWASLYRVYLDPVERRRRPWLYGLIPCGVYFAGTLFYAVNPAWFWTGLAYVAVHHFVKQQVGFVALYRHGGGENSEWSRRLDHAAVYTATLVPIAWWHTRLPLSFEWFTEGDFLGPWPAELMTVLWPAYGAVAAVWLVFRAREVHRARRWNAGRDLTMLATWTMWGVGIVVLDSDYVFTATNVLLHGVPYIALVWLTTHRRCHPGEGAPRLLAWITAPKRAIAFVGLLIAVALAEEGLWDNLVWHEHAQVFGDWALRQEWLPLVFVPLLTVPQATHYVLDGFIWRGGEANPQLRDQVFGS